MGRKGGCAQIAPWPDRQIMIEITIEKGGQEQRWGNDKMMTCVQLALTAFSDHTFVCTDNGSLAKLIGVSACTGPGRPRVLAIPLSATDTACECALPDSMALYEDQTRR